MQGAEAQRLRHLRESLHMRTISHAFKNDMMWCRSASGSSLSLSAGSPATQYVPTGVGRLTDTHGLDTFKGISSDGLPAVGDVPDGRLTGTHRLDTFWGISLDGLPVTGEGTAGRLTGTHRLDTFGGISSNRRPART